MPDRRRFIGGVGATLATSWARPARAADVAIRSVDVRDPVVGPLLARNRTFHTGAARGANHSSMAILALAALGGSPTQIRDFGEGLIGKRRPPFPEGGGAIKPDSWQASLGYMQALPAFRRFYSDEIARRGLAATLRRHIPPLMAGLAAAEFHCMIRTAYAVRFGDPEEAAVGLAYWSAAFMPLGPLGPSGTQRDPIACLAEVRARYADAVVGNVGGGKAGALKAASLLPGFSAVASTLAIDDQSLARIARTMVRLFALPGRDLLHTVTGTHAYRTLEPYLADPKQGRRHLWQALVAYYLAEGTPEPSASPAPKLPTWSEVVATAIASPDDHGVKLTYSALEEYRLYGDLRYLQVAARRQRMV